MSRRTQPSRVVTVLLAVSVLVSLADLALIFAVGGHPAFGQLLGLIGCAGVLGSVWLNHRQMAR